MQAADLHLEAVVLTDLGDLLLAVGAGRDADLRARCADLVRFRLATGQRAELADFVPFSMGKRVLRAETASWVALTLILNQRGEL